MIIVTGKITTIYMFATLWQYFIYNLYKNFSLYFLWIRMAWCERKFKSKKEDLIANCRTRTERTAFVVYGKPSAKFKRFHFLFIQFIEFNGLRYRFELAVIKTWKVFVLLIVKLKHLIILNFSTCQLKVYTFYWGLWILFNRFFFFAFACN